MKIEKEPHAVMKWLAEQYVAAGFPNHKVWNFSFGADDKSVPELRALGLIEQVGTRGSPFRLTDAGQRWIMANRTEGLTAADDGSSRQRHESERRMYNLLVTGAEGAWDKPDCVLDVSRYLEYTNESISTRLRSMDDKVCAELMSLPTLFAYETAVRADARVGWITRIHKREGEIRIAFRFDPEVEAIEPNKVASLVWELEIGNYEMNRTHWAVKEVDLLQVLNQKEIDDAIEVVPPYKRHQSTYVSAKPAARKITFAPNVFQVPDGSVELDLAAVMMPFNKEFAPVHDAIRAACAAAGLRCLRADDIWEESTIIQDIFNLIFRAQIVVVDFTGKNPNVMYETGIAHTLGKHVIPITQSIADVPSDTGHHRALKYLSNAEGLAALQNALAMKLRQYSMPNTP